MIARNLRLPLLAAILTMPMCAAEKTIDDVWAGVDPRAEALDIEVLRKWTENGAAYTEMYFTGLTHEGEKVRVYGMYAAPEGGRKLPAVLHIHGGGQTVNKGWLKTWTARGYAAMSFNWGGEWPNRDKYTLWGKLIQGNHAKSHESGMHMATKPSVRLSSWFLWTLVSRRALTVLERQPEVDPERLGIFGVSMGGTIVWNFAGTDKRVKAAAAVYGVGWNTYPEAIGDPDPKAADPEVALWRATMEPESYPGRIECPVLFLDGTNDQHGKMDWAYKTTDALHVEHREAFTPQYRHHIGSAQASDLLLWMDWWLKGGEAWPKSPKVSVRLSRSGVPELMVDADQSQKIQSVQMYYALENRGPKNRFWRTLQGNPPALMPVIDVSRPLFAFANVNYESGVSITSNLASVTPAALGKAKATDKPTLSIDDFSGGVGDWVTSSTGTDPIPPVFEAVKSATGPGWKAAVTTDRTIELFTHKIGDPKWRGPDGTVLKFRVYSKAARELTVAVYRNWVETGNQKFSHTLSLKPSDEWQEVELRVADFRTEKGLSLSAWSEAQVLSLHSPGPGNVVPLYADFRWAPK